MVVGENNREQDMDINPCREKKLTNVRWVWGRREAEGGAEGLLGRVA
jgi:predicted membrane GTPase involved in stress response